MSSFTRPTLRVTGFDGPAAVGDPNGHYWAKLSTEILADPEVPDAEKVALTAIVSLSRAGACTETNEALGRACGKSEETFARLARNLERRGLIERDHRGPFRTIRLNFGFRGPATSSTNPVTSAGVNNCPTPAQAPTNPVTSADQPRRDCRPTPAPAPPTLRMAQRATDPALDRGPAPARVGQAPPSPSPEGPGGEKSGLMPCPADPPQCPDLDDTTRRRMPPRGGSMFAPWPTPIVAADVLSPQQQAWRSEILAGSDPLGRAYAEAWIAIKRHNAATWHGLASVAQQNGQPQALESEKLAVPEIAVESARSSLPNPEQESSNHSSDHNNH